MTSRLYTLPIWLILAATAGLQADKPAEARFLLIGDWGRGPEDAGRHAAQRQVAEAMGRATADQPPRAVICLGDNFYPAGAPTADSPLFTTAFEQVYTAPSLQVPFWILLGNHDYYVSARGALDYSAQRRGSGRWTLPDRHWSRTVEVAPDRRAKFVMLDTCAFVKKYRVKGEGPHAMPEVRTLDAAAQLAWLDQELSEPGIAWRIVCGHHPIWSGGGHGDTAELKELVLPILRRHRVHVYACGHDHHGQVHAREGLTHVISGHASDAREAKPTEGSVFLDRGTGFADLTLGGDKGALRMRDADGKVIFTQPLER